MFFEKILCKKKQKTNQKKKKTIRNLFFGADNLASTGLTT